MKVTGNNVSSNWNEDLGYSLSSKLYIICTFVVCYLLSFVALAFVANTND